MCRPIDHSDCTYEREGSKCTERERDERGDKSRLDMDGTYSPDLTQRCLYSRARRTDVESRDGRGFHGKNGTPSIHTVEDVQEEGIRRSIVFFSLTVLSVVVDALLRLYYINRFNELILQICLPPFVTRILQSHLPP